MKHFTLAELTRTSARDKKTFKPLANEPNAQVVECLTALVDNVIDPLREHYGKPIRVTSGYRSKEVNERVGGAPTSQHTKGEAVDFVCEDMKATFEIIRTTLPFDQLIWEKGDNKQPQWIHVSFKKAGKNRGEVLRYNGKTYKPF